jgi:cytochrome c553
MSRLVAAVGKVPVVAVSQLLRRLRMKKVCLTLLLGAVVMALSAGSASAIPPFNIAWKAKYLEGNNNKAFVDAATTANCSVCHEPGMDKKLKNEYGKAAGKYLVKADYMAIKADAEKAKQYVQEGFAKLEAEKSAAGKTYGELIKEGKLPAAP